MPIRVVHDHPVTQRWRRARRRLALLAGAVLVLVGLLAGALPLLFVVLLVAGLVRADIEVPDLDAESTGLLLTLLVVAVVGLAGGLRLARGRRSGVLFLRRFQLAAPTEALSYAAAHAIGRRWRVVTLDDADVEAVGVARGLRRASGLGLVLAVVLVGSALFWVFGGAFADFLSGLEVETADSASIGDVIGALLGTFVVVLVVGGLVLTGVLTLAAFFGLVGIFSWSARRAALRAERSKSAAIRHHAEIAPYTRALVRRTRGILGPRLVVVRAGMDVWRDVVISLAQVCEVVVVDLSDPTESLLWEIETLQGLQKPLILVGESSRLGPLAAATGRSPLLDRLATALGDAEVLAYGQDPEDVRRFANALRARLQDAV